MSAPLVPSPLDYVGPRRFVVFPPVAGVEPNEWVRGTRSWAGAQLVNAITGQEVWIPWQYICGVSDRAGYQLVLELTQELEVAEGMLKPRVQRVISMPVGATSTRPRRRKGLAPVIGIRTGDEPAPKTSMVGRVVLGALVLFALASLVFRLITL